MKFDDKETYREFYRTVNMSAAELERWLGTEKSVQAGGCGDEGDDREACHRIARLQRLRKERLRDDDLRHMDMVIRNIHRRRPTEPDCHIARSEWRHVLMNWGHDPDRENHSTEGIGMTMIARWNGEEIARSDDTVVVEGNHYFPAHDVNRSALTPSDHTSTCPWKGTAQYHSVNAGGAINKDAAWYYPDPKEAASEIKDRIAFWNGVEVVEE